MRSLFLLPAILTLAACSPQPQGDTYQDYVSGREAELNGTINGPSVSSSSLDAAPVATYGGSSTTASSQYVVSGPNRAAAFAGISDEQNFAAVSSRESIESDKARLEANRAQYQEIAPTALPQRSGSSGPNIVVYALQTQNPVGQQAYSRVNPLRGSFNASACGKYASPDLAQEAFLKSGGPERDPRSLDPDGDGYACSWDPTPFRAAVR